MSYECLEVEREGHVAVVYMNRAPVNAQNAQMRSEIIEVFDSFNDDDDVRCVVLASRLKVFSAGADVSERPAIKQKGPGAYWRHNRLVRESSLAIAECNKPIIAAVNGAALGAGFGLMTSCDIWVASSDAYVSMPEINVGLAGGTALLQRVFGKSRARRMFFTGMKVSADELYRLGLIEASLPPDQLMPYVMDLAREIAGKAPIALRYAKEASQVTASMPPREGYRFEQNITVALSNTEDSREAQRAFLEKRAPVYKGR
ncbi:enoyl-CoA hydratase/isomerase family protein [Bordetella genomosp. 13]|uniref:enoyl-CoA hydratase/isomerase family protein n=1 Tax=Bordetella genomosp. 13 TaxID=463040 RepID=UPI0011A045F1|nr:enoyl-CoA hydratase/isomerase family protein [Bordetella genomosp. 13]